MSEEFYRIKRLPPYIFAEVNAFKAQARGGASCTGRAGGRFSRRIEEGGAALDPGAARDRAELPGQPDGADRRSRFLWRGRRVLPPPRDLCAVRPRLCRNLFRGPAAALD